MAEYTVKLDILYTASVTVDASCESDAVATAKLRAKRDQVDKDFCEATSRGVEIEPTS